MIMTTFDFFCLTLGQLIVILTIILGGYFIILRTADFFKQARCPFCWTTKTITSFGPPTKQKYCAKCRTKYYNYGWRNYVKDKNQKKPAIWFLRAFPFQDRCWAIAVGTMLIIVQTVASITGISQLIFAVGLGLECLVFYLAVKVLLTSVFNWLEDRARFMPPKKPDYPKRQNRTAPVNIKNFNTRGNYGRK